MKWVLHYISIEPAIGEYTYADSTGQYVPPEQVDGFFKELPLIHSKNFPGELERLLIEMRSAKIVLRELRKKVKTHALQNEEVKKSVEKYFSLRSKLIAVLVSNFNIQIKETGIPCR